VKLKVISLKILIFQGQN